MMNRLGDPVPYFPALIDGKWYLSKDGIREWIGPFDTAAEVWDFFEMLTSTRLPFSSIAFAIFDEQTEGLK